MSDANKAEVEVEINFEGNAEESAVSLGDAIDSVDAKVKKLRKTLSQADQDARDLFNRERAFNRSVRFGKPEPTREEIDHASDARRAERDRQRMRNAKPPAPPPTRDEIDAKYDARRAENERQKGRYAKPESTPEERWIKAAQGKADKTRWEVEQGLREDPTIVKARKEAEREAKRKVPLTPEQADAKYLDGLRESERKKQLAVAAGLRKGEQEQGWNPPTSVGGVLRQGAHKVASTLGGEEGAAALGMTMAVAAAAIYIGKEVVGAIAHVAREVNAVDAKGYASKAEREDALMSSLPVVGWLHQQNRAIAQNETDEAGKYGDFARNKERTDLEVRGVAIIDAKRLGMQTAKDAAVTKYESSRDYSPYAVTGDRETQAGRRIFQERMAEEPGVNRQRRAQAEVKALGDELGSAKFRDNELSQERARLLKLRREAQGKANDERLPERAPAEGKDTRKPVYGDTAASKEAAQAVKKIDDQLAAVSERKEMSASAVAEVKRKLLQAKSEASAGLIDSLKGQKETADYRENAARSGMERIGMMGPEGRIRFHQAAEFVNQYGLENAPDDIRSAYSAGAPETARQKAMEVGEKYRKEFSGLAPEETGYRFKAQEQAEKSDKLKVEIAEADKERIAALNKGVADVLIENNKTLIDLIMNVRQDLLNRIPSDQFVNGPSPIR